MNRRFLRHSIEKAYRVKKLLAPRELKALQAYSMAGLSRLQKLNELASEVVGRGVPGDFVECGVYNGGSAAAVSSAFRDTEKHVWLFDSFEGMPNVTEADGIEAQDFVGKCVGSEEKVREAMRLIKFPSDRSTILSGWFKDTFFSGPLPETVAFLHIDADWYDSVKISLETFYDRVADGGVIVLDDFGCWEGCREAFYDFVAKRGIKPLLERFEFTQAYWVNSKRSSNGLNLRRLIG